MHPSLHLEEMQNILDIKRYSAEARRTLGIR